MLSPALTEKEQKYSQTGQETLAVVYGAERFHLYLLGSTFTIITDHEPLLGMWKSPKPTTARIERCRLRLMPYEMTSQYWPGRDELNPADYTSRHSHTRARSENAAEAYVNYVSKNAVPKAMAFDEVREVAQQDSQLQKVMCAIQTGRWLEADLRDFSKFKEELIVIHATHGVILRHQRLVIPPSLHRRVVDIDHQLHQGIVKTKQRILENAWFSGIDKKVNETVKSCIFPPNLLALVKTSENLFVQPSSLKAHGLILQMTLLVRFRLVTTCL